MIDYLLGDTDSALKALGSNLSEKYRSIHAFVEIDGDIHTFERRWKEPSLRSKIIIDDDAVSPAEFSSNLLELLSIPEVHYPKGDPYSPNTWPTLSWKQLMRHIYRRQVFWGDIADRQYDDDQHACLTLFLGAAEFLYSEQYAKYVELNKRRIVLEQAKDQYGALFAELYHYISEDTSAVDPTEQVIHQAEIGLTAQIDRSTQRKQVLMGELLGRVKRRTSAPHVKQLGQEWERQQVQRSEALSNIVHAEKRISELEDYQRSVVDELGRYKRTRRAVQKLVDLQVTHCPVCDQTVRRRAVNANTCFLCSQPLDGRDAIAAGEERIRFEVAQLEGEQEEVGDLIATVQAQRDELLLQLRQIDDALSQIEAALADERRVVNVLPAELGHLDSELGALQERLRLFGRMKLILGRREDRAKHIDGIAAEMETLRGQISEQSEALDLEQKSDILSAAMNNYLTALNREFPDTWSQGPVAIKVGRNRFSIEVDGEPWRSKLGATLRLYLLLAYHYALLTLSNRPSFHYPGLLILDFPGEIAQEKQFRIKRTLCWHRS